MTISMRFLTGLCALMLSTLAATAAPASSSTDCIPASPAEQFQNATAVVDVTAVGLRLGEAQAEIELQVDQVLKDDSGTLTPGGTLTLPTSLPDELVAGEVPFNEGWSYWRLFLHPLEPGSSELRTTLCSGSAPIPAPARAVP